MHFGAQLQAAIEVIDQIETRHRPAADALQDWGRSHRFAGSGDRAVIGNLVFDCLRRRRSLAARSGDDSARLAVLGVAVHLWQRPLEEIAELCARQYGAGALTAPEQTALQSPMPEDATLAVRGDFQDWLEHGMQRAFGADVEEQASALCNRAPVDLRVNGLKADREKVLRALSRYGAVATPYAPMGIRVPPPEAGNRYPNLEAEAAHGKGWFEVQDEGSQLAAALSGALPGTQVMDLCAGAGGKTLALAAAMENKGQIHAYDSDRIRLRKIFERLKRAGARNVQVIDAGNEDRIKDLEQRMDVVLVDAPCSGSGTWRRRPDAKWRLSAQALSKRCAEQRDVLNLGSPLVKPGGRMVYVTCSVLPEENTDQVSWFLNEHPNFRLVSWRDGWSGTDLPNAGGGDCLMLTPHTHGTDGFFIALLERTDTQ